MSDPLERLAALQAADLPVHGGRTLAYVYDSGDPEVDRVGREAVAAYAASNALDPTAFPSLLRMENELVGFACGLLDAPPSAVGTNRSAGHAVMQPRTEQSRHLVSSTVMWARSPSMRNSTVDIRCSKLISGYVLLLMGSPERLQGAQPL